VFLFYSGSITPVAFDAITNKKFTASGGGLRLGREWIWTCCSLRRSTPIGILLIPGILSE